MFGLTAIGGKTDGRRSRYGAGGRRSGLADLPFSIETGYGRSRRLEEATLLDSREDMTKDRDSR